MTLKRRLRLTLDYTARLSGILQRFERGMNRGLTVLMYHRVLPETQCQRYPFRSLVMPEYFFRQQMQWLASQCEVLPLYEALEKNAFSSYRKRPLVSLSFDDGYADNYDIAAEILDELGIRATFFVTTGFIGTNTTLWFDRAAMLLPYTPYEALEKIVKGKLNSISANRVLANHCSQADWISALKECEPEVRYEILMDMEQASGSIGGNEDYRSMSIEQLANLHRRGHEIGSHTVTHAMLPQLTDAQLESELTQSKKTLEKWLVASIRGFCYPNGDFDKRTIAAVHAAGYSYACATRPGINLTNGDSMKLSRMDITQDNVSDSSGRYDEVVFRSELCSFHNVWR